MDATASREPTWDHACAIQGEMFVAADTLVQAVLHELFSSQFPAYRENNRGLTMVMA
jgi:hypothetical protein